MVDNKLSPKDVQNIVLLNNIMNNNEYFRAITGTDTGCINQYNIHLGTRILELHTYLIKNYTLIPKLFSYDNTYNWNVLNHLMGLMDGNNTPISTLLKGMGIE